MNAKIILYMLFVILIIVAITALFYGIGTLLHHRGTAETDREYGESIERSKSDVGECKQRVREAATTLHDLAEEIRRNQKLPRS